MTHQQGRLAVAQRAGLSSIVYSLGALAMAGALGCTTNAPVDEGLAPALGAALSGDVVVLVPLEQAHPVVLFLTRIDLSEEGLPVYTTINLTVVTQDQLSQGDDAGVGRTGSYALAPVPEGSYVLTGIVDVDENFNPFVSVPLEGPDPDLQGGYINLSTGSPVFELVAGQVASEINVYFTNPAATSTPTPETPTPTAAEVTPTP